VRGVRRVPGQEQAEDQQRSPGHPHELGPAQVRRPHPPDPIGIDAAIASSAASSQGPCAVIRRCSPPAVHESSRTGRSGGCASGSGACRHAMPSRISTGPPSGRSRGGGGSTPAYSAIRPGAPGRESSRFHATSAPSPHSMTSTHRASGSGAAGRGNARPRRASAAAMPSSGWCTSPPTLRVRRAARQVGSCTDMPDLRWALTVPFSGIPLAAHGELFRRIEAAGYDDVWTSETAGYDGFTPLALAAVHTERLRLATGVVNPFTRGPAVLAQHCAALADASGGRFVLGLGSSSNVVVERWNGVPFEKPLSRMRSAIEALRPVLAGERGPGGFKLDTAPEAAVPIVVAALRGKMLGLAAELGDGAFTNFLPLSGTRQ